MKDRIKMIMERTKLTQNEFANKTGISAPSLSSIFTGRTNPTNKHVKAIHNAFPDVSINWLLFGEGEPYISNSGEKGNENIVSTDGRNESEELLSLIPSGNVPASEVKGILRPETVSDETQKRLEKKLLEKLLEQKTETSEAVRRKITEIRVFFDDGTYETFSPSGK